MRKIILASAMVLALGGCAQLQEAFNAGKFITASITNPVTNDRLDAAEKAITVVISVGNAWKHLCIKGLAETNCRTNIAAAQVYTRKLPALLVQVRTFVKNNDQVNAILVYNQIMESISTFKGQVVAAGVPGAGAL